MPVKRTRLSAVQQARYLGRAQELIAAGIDCEIPHEWHENSRSVEISVAPPQENILRELATGVTAYAIEVRLLGLRGNLVFEDFTIASEWDSDLVALRANGKNLYGVGAAFEFTEREVLNPRIEKGIHFRRGDVAKGWVLARGYKPIPDEYPDRMTTVLTLTFTDQFGYDHPARAKAILERSARRKGKWIQGSRSRKPIGVLQTESVSNRTAPLGTSIGVANVSNLRLRPE